MFKMFLAISSPIMPKCLKVEFHLGLSLNLSNLLAYYEVPPAGCFREEVENVKIWFSSHNFMTVVGGATKT